MLMMIFELKANLTYTDILLIDGVWHIFKEESVPFKKWHSTLLAMLNDAAPSVLNQVRFYHHL